MSILFLSAKSGFAHPFAPGRLIFLCWLWIASAIAVAENAPALRVELGTEAPGVEIHRNIYGQFMEHLGRGIYEGIWVGEHSRIPHRNGLRLDVLNALKELRVPLLRWPGGCFADEYHWQDGIGPRDKRKKTVNTSWGGVIDDNGFGTHEFFMLAEALGAEVYINGNLGTGTPREMAEWLEYMTSDSDSTLANLRRQNGREKPWRVHYFAVGNESWGCGGTMRPQYYADLYKHYATFLKTPADNRPVLIASGGHTDQIEWTQTLMEQVPKTFGMRMDAISHHYYTLPTGDWKKHGRATAFSEEEWISTFANTLRIEAFIAANTAIMDKHDPSKEIGFFVDEWGTWYDAEEGDNPGFLYQQNTLRDALVASLNLNIFHRYAERVKMTNIAQMVNVLQAMILTQQEKMVLTPTYHLYQMYIPFQGARALPVAVQGYNEYRHGGHTIPRLSASAARANDASLWLALTNTHPAENQKVEISAPGSRHSAVGKLLTAKTMDAHNDFARPQAVQPVDFRVEQKRPTATKTGGLTLDLPPKSVVVVQLK